MFKDDYLTALGVFGAMNFLAAAIILLVLDARLPVVQSLLAATARLAAAAIAAGRAAAAVVARKLPCLRRP